MTPIKLLGLELAAMIALLVIGPKLNPALPTFRILLPFCDCVMLPALRTRIAHRELPIFLDFHGARPSDGWTGDAVAAVDARKAYETALHLLQRLSLGSAEQARFDEKALHLKGLFEQLGLSP
jgi:hypothetical protein